MKQIDIVRAWKDQEYFDSLSAEQRAAVPANPAGELTAIEAEQITGGNGLMTTKLTGGHGCDECDIK